MKNTYKAVYKKYGHTYSILISARNVSQAIRKFHRYAGHHEVYIDSFEELQCLGECLMNAEVYRILNCVKSDAAKIEDLSDLSKDIELAKNVLSGKFKFCSCCNDYYLAKSFIEERDTIPTRVCTFVDIINSGGNEYKDGFADITYIVCPKGHRHEVSRHERVDTSKT